MIIQPSPEWQYMTANSAMTGNAATTPGATVVSAASNSDAGAYVGLITTPLTHDVHYLVIGLAAIHWSFPKIVVPLFLPHALHVPMNGHLLPQSGLHQLDKPQ